MRLLALLPLLILSAAVTAEDEKSASESAPEVGQLVAMAQNKDMPVEARRDALAGLINLVDARDSTSEQRKAAYAGIMRSLVETPPALTHDIFRFLREMNTPRRVVPVLVHFVYPHDDENRTPEVRADATLTMAELGDLAALPTLFYSLRDDSLGVRTAIDESLARVTGAPRAPSPDRIRRHWERYLHTEEGGRLLIAGMAKIEAMFANRTPQSPRTEPITGAAAMLIMDEELAFNPWAAACEYLQRRLGKDFRPKMRHGKPVEPGDRKELVAAVREWWRADERSKSG